jgi:Phage stabilisation protein
MQIQFAIQSYQARALPFSAQRTINYFAETAPKDAKTPVVVYNAPGTMSFCDGLAGAVRGAHIMGGVLYVVAGNVLYSVDSAGTETSLGTINTFVGNVSMAVNRANPQQLCFVDGADGWIYDTSGGLQEIVDADFQPADTVTFQDGYFIFDYKGTSRFFISALDDGTSYTATDVGSAEGSPDAVVAVYSNHRELWVFGEESIEVFYNSGNADFPFERIAGAFLERGCAAAFSVADEDNTLFWLGNDRIVYRAQGYVPQRISTHAIEEILRTFSIVSDAFGFFVTISGHKFYHLTFPTGGYTFVYDAATGLWHERQSFGAAYWRGNAYAYAYEKHIVGDAFVGRMGALDMDTFTEYGETMQGILASPPVHKDRKRIFHRSFEVDIESGVGTTTGGDPYAWLEYSDDGGRTWSLRKPFASLGKIGEYRSRLRSTRMGQSRERIYRMTIADAVKRSILAAHADLEMGSN